MSNRRILVEHKDNFNTLRLAFANGDVCLAPCLNRRTGKNVIVICAVNRSSEGITDLVPLAKLFSGIASKEITLPTVQLNTFFGAHYNIKGS